MGYEVIWQSTVAGLATLLGALIVVSLGEPSERILAAFLGFAGGIMTAVVVLDLIPSALDYGNIFIASLGFFLGIFFMFTLDLLISFFPGLHQNETKGRKAQLLKMGYLIAAGIALHDLPEGIAIAVGYSAKESLGFLIALSIGLHNIPEGMATAAPLTMSGVSNKRVIYTALAISFFTPIGAFLGLVIITISPNLISLLLSLAGGAMAFIVKSELIPESYQRHPNYSRLGFFFGVILIVLLGYVHV